MQLLTIWISVEETEVEGEVRFADAILKMASRRELDALIENRFKNTPAETVRLTKEKFHRTWLGKATMRFSLEAEPKRAQELALEKAQDYMALLQLYGLAPTVFPLVSYAAPSGTRSRGASRSIAVRDGKFIHASASLAGVTSDLHLGNAYYREMEKVGLSALSDLALHRNSEYENDLFNSLLVYGRACYQIDPIDKLLQIITAIEMFLLKDGTEPIMASVADRIAYVIAKETLKNSAPPILDHEKSTA